jgi:hypothetical protein
MEEKWQTRIHDPREYKVFKALADPSWDFRTIHGISESTGIPEPEIVNTLARYPELVRKSPIPDRKGRQLFTLRSRRPKAKELFAEIRSFVTKST